MYRIHFDVARGVWLLQFLKLGFLWFTVRREIPGEGASFRVEDETFDTVEQVDAYVTSRGIDKVYRRMANPIEKPPLFYTSESLQPH